MARPNFDVDEVYIGANNNDVYSFDFKIEDITHLLVVVYDATGEEVHRVRGDDTTEFLLNTQFNPVAGGGHVILQANLPNLWEMHLLLANDAPTQPSEFKDKFSFTLARFEAALDFLAGAVQRLAYLAGRSMRLSEKDDPSVFNPALPPIPDDIDSNLLQRGPGGWIWVTPAQVASEGSGGSGTPEGGVLGSVLTKLSDDDFDADWVPHAYDGFSARFNQNFQSDNLNDTLLKILDFSYLPPQVSLSASGSGTIREKGDDVTSSNLSASITKRSDPIAAVRFYLDNVLIHTVASPNPNGGTETYNWTGSFDDTSVFKVEVDDNGDTGGPTTVQSTSTFTFVYPYYVGAGAPSLAASAVAGLTKRIITSTANRTEVIAAANSDVFYFAYPASYGALTSILDVNNFETFPDWTLRTENITGLDGNPVSYRIYEFNNPVTAGSYQYTFRR